MENFIEFKNLLLAEKTRLEGELSGIAHKNPDIKGDWEPSAPDLNIVVADPDEVADSIEKFENQAAIEVELEAELMNVTAALTRIEAGTYGTCTICKAPIEEARLRANPSARTCIAHREK